MKYIDDINRVAYNNKYYDNCIEICLTCGH